MNLESVEEEVIVKVRGQYAEKYTPDALQEALEKIRNNEMSYGAASKVYNVPKATLHNKMKNPEVCARGASTILTKEQEDELVDWILTHADFGDPRTKQDIIIAAAEIAQLDDTSGKFKNGVPTSGWMEGFLQRHPSCRVRTPQGISKASAINTRDDFAGLWRNIYTYFEKTNQLDLLNVPELWWNADETYFEKDKIPKKVIARRGARRVSRREMGPPKSNTTVTYAFSAAGDFVEPLITLKDSNSSVAEIAFSLGSVGANYGINQTESGWTKTESFYYFVSIHLHNQWEAKGCPKPRILTIDGYGAHLSPKLFRWCRRNAVIIIVLYPGATPFMQMCDTTMFGPMKQKHAQIYSQWRLKNPTKTMNEVEFVKILKQINDEVIKKESIINGWRATGLQPFNFNNLNTAGLLSKSSDRVYDFKGFLVNPPSQSIDTTAGITNHPKNDQVQCDDELSSVIDIKRPENSQVQHNAKRSSSLEDNQVQCNAKRSSSLEDNQVQCNAKRSSSPEDDQVQCNAESFCVLGVDTEIELVDVFMEEIPVGPLNLATEVETYEHQLQSSKYDPKESAAPTGQIHINDSVTFSQIAGSSDILKSQSGSRFELSDFGISTKDATEENDSRMGKLADKIRRDVNQLGLLCAASNKSKLVNILIINQQLNVIDPPVVEDVELPQEVRTIKSILKPPTMPQRAKPKRNLNLKVSYGVVTAKEIVQSITDRELADKQHEIEREKNDIEKIARDNEITAVDDELKSVRKVMSVTRSEIATLNKEIIQNKKNKTAGRANLEAEKSEKDILLKAYDVQVRGLREKLKNLKSVHVETNKAVSLKRKNFELQKKETGNKVQPSVAPSEIDDMELDADNY